MNKEYRCSVSGEIIPPLRVEYLLTTNIPEEEWTTVKYASNRKVKGFFIQPADLGENEVDTSSLMIVDKVYNDSVRSILKAESEESDPDAGDESPDIHAD